MCGLLPVMCRFLPVKSFYWKLKGVLVKGIFIYKVKVFCVLLIEDLIPLRFVQFLLKDCWFKRCRDGDRGVDTEHGHLLWELSPSLSLSLQPRQFSRCWTQGNNWGPVPSEYQVSLLTKLECPASSMAMVV